ncbi:calmodulin-like protein containing EF hand domain [Diplonema papillatum]|nr:calmodulin-like protein containing EF hand domain [Diplonema papillatum]
MFTLLVCADLQGGKVNLELTFQALPTIGELTRKTEEVFGHEMKVIGGPYANVEFRVNRLQIYDDVLLKWVDLLSTTQLHEYDQIYAFQPQTPWHVDTTQDLPAPRPPATQGGSYGGAMVPPGMPAYAPQGGAGMHPGYDMPQGYPAGPQGYPGFVPAGADRPNLPTAEKVAVVFKEIDFQGKGYIDYPEFERALHERGLDFSANTTGELFYKADLNRDGRVTFEEWVNWAQIYPNTVETLYFRCKDTSEESMLRGQIQRAQDQLAANHARIAQLQRESDQNAATNHGLRSQVGTMQQQAAAAAQKRQEITPDEKELLEEEIKMERQKDQMRMQQARFQEASTKFNRGAASKGSPRRARDVATY